jgi:acetolactate synthase-1/2/3 large subunit
VTLPLAHELWRNTDAVLAVGTRMLMQQRQWGIDDQLAVVRVDSDPHEPGRLRAPAAALIGNAGPILRRLIEALPAHNLKRRSRRAEMARRQAIWRERLAAALGPQVAFLDALRAELPEDGIYVDEVTQIGFAARLAFPVYRPRTFLSPGYQDNLGWGYATALGAQHARPDVPVVSINGDGGFLFTASELATAVHHRIPLTAVVFNDGAFGNVRRIQAELYGNRQIASDLHNPDFVRFAQSFGAAAERAKSPRALRAALRRALQRRDGPSLIEVPVEEMPSPRKFIMLPRVRGG